MSMGDIQDILEFAETLIHRKTATYCSELQRQILLTALQEERKTYDQLAKECGYSPKYVKQDVAPKLWQLLSHILETKVTKANVRAALEQAMRRIPADLDVIYPGLSHQAQPGISAQALSAESPPANLAQIKATILLVDDQPQNLRLLSELLEEQGYDVQQAINGKVALQAISHNRPDLILLDIYMPEMDGYSVCQQIKANPTTQDIPVIFISALDEAWDKVKAFSAGGNDYITKPFKVVEVLARVENQLGIQQLQQVLKNKNSQLQQAIHELQRLAAIDELTQVANRRRFDTYLLNCWENAIEQQQQLSLMFVQIDNFSLYHETTDLQAGDRALRHLAHLIQEATAEGAENLVCRYGTLTFAVIIPRPDIASRDTSPLELTQQRPTAQDTTQTDTTQTDTTEHDTYIQKLAKTVLQRAHKISTPTDSIITLSIGIATARPSATSKLEDFLIAGDRNLQKANSQGGNCIIASP
ncbi:MAG: response regulator [Cyanobacteria bacterium J06623_5]